jgi:hypothetical protein
LFGILAFLFGVLHLRLVLGETRNEIALHLANAFLYKTYTRLGLEMGEMLETRGNHRSHGPFQKVAI